MVKKEDVKEDVVLKAGTCDILIERDEKGRPTLTPICPVGEKGLAELSTELMALNDLLRSSEVVLKPAKAKETEKK